jgi:hypothetical protein
MKHNRTCKTKTLLNSKVEELLQEVDKFLAIKKLLTLEHTLILVEETVHRDLIMKLIQKISECKDR